MVAVSLLYRKGYFRQRLSEEGAQNREPVEWAVEKQSAAGRAAHLRHARGPQSRVARLALHRQGRSRIRSASHFLDADLPSNDQRDRELTGQLYGGDPYYRLSQEVLLGIGGVRILRALGHTDLMRYHMNEGHAALLTLELLERRSQPSGRTFRQGEDIEKVRASVFSPPTPPCQPVTTNFRWST